MALRCDNWNGNQGACTATTIVEDIQPNERRMLPKGCGVPLVKSSQHTTSVYHVRWDRQHNTNHKASHQRYKPHKRSVHVKVRPRNTGNTAPAPKRRDNLLPTTSNISPRPSTVVQQTNIGEKRTLDHFNTDISEQQRSQIQEGSSHKRRKTGPDTHVFLFPPHVQSHKSRRDFAMQERDKFAKEHNVDVFAHQYIGDGVRISYRPTRVIPRSDTIPPFPTVLTGSSGIPTLPQPVSLAPSYDLPNSRKENIQGQGTTTVPNIQSSVQRDSAEDGPTLPLSLAATSVDMAEVSTSCSVVVKVERDSPPVPTSTGSGNGLPDPQSSPNIPLALRTNTIRQPDTPTIRVPAPALSSSPSHEEKREANIRAFKSGTLKFKRYATSSSTTPTPKRRRTSTDMFQGNPVHVMSPTTSSASPEITKTMRSQRTEGTQDFINDVFNRDGTLDEELARVLRDSGDVGCSKLLYKEDGDAFQLLRGPNDKPRRILVAQSRTIITTMYGRVHEIFGEPRKYQRQLVCESGSKPSRSDDSCVLTPPNDNIIVIARHGELESDSKGGCLRLHDVSREKRSRALLDPDNRVTTISAIHALPRSLRFVTGGMDGQKHAVRLWEVNDDMTLKSSIRLDITHTAPIRAILPTGPCRTKLLSGGEDRTIHAYDLGGERKFTTIDCSNKVHHLHETLERDSILVELQHRDSQFEVRDLRAYSSKTKPDARFGYEAVGRRANAAATKGDIKNYTFAFGDECGIVRLWDLRNTKNVVQQFQCHWGPQIVHVKFHDDLLAVCSTDSQIKFFNRVC